MKKLLPIGLGLAATVSMIGCMQSNPLAGSPQVSTLPTSHFVINFAHPTYATKAAGDHHTEVRIMYTSAYVRSATFGKDYHIGLVANGTTGYKFNYGTPLANATQSLYYKTAPTSDDPIFSAIGVGASSDSINVASNSAAYFEGPGIIVNSMPAASTDVATEIFNSSFTSPVGTYSSVDQVLESKVLISAAEGMFATLFSKASYTTTGSAITTWSSIPSVITTTTAAKGVVSRTLTSNGTNTYSTLFYKFILPAGVTKLDLGNLPLGRVVLDYRSYEGDGTTVSKYGYGQFMLKPNDNQLNISAMDGTPAGTASMSF